MVAKNLFRAWLVIAKNQIQRQLLTRSSAYLFIIGKILQFVFNLVIISSVFRTTSNIKGYTIDQAILFILVFFTIESVSQFLFRSIYRFRPVLLRGAFDLDLVKPLPGFSRSPPSSHPYCFSSIFFNQIQYHSYLH